MATLKVLSTNFAICEICKGPFKDQRELDEHSKSHSTKSGQISFLECEKCKKSFKKQKQLNIHLWRHLGIVSCRDCDKRFSSLADLKKHEQKDHTFNKKVKNKNFLCDICQNGFSQKKNLTIHLKLHKNPDLFKCNHCSKKFTRAESLRKHKKMMQTPDVFKCKLCHKRFDSQSRFLSKFHI